MAIRSITFRIVAIFVGISLAGVVFILSVANQQLRDVIGESHEAEYHDQLEHIWSSLDIAVHRLKQTEMREVYEADFQERIIENLRSAYYASGPSDKHQCIYPFIVNSLGKVIMHPNHKRGERFFSDKAFIEKMFAEKEGDLAYQDEHGETISCHFMFFPEWDWMVGMVVPHQVKFSDARRFQYRMIAVMTVSILLAGGLLAIFVGRIMCPVSQLTVASKALAAGDLHHVIDIRGHDEIGELAESFVAMRDALRKKISDLADKNEKLQESEQRFRTLIQQAGDAAFVLDGEGMLHDVNEQACMSLRYSRDELLGKNITDIDSEFALHMKNNENWNKVTSSHAATFAGLHHRKDGSTFPVEVRLRVLQLNGQRRFLIFSRDITDRVRAEEERKKLESQLLHAQKLEAIGRLAGGIAHDFNNILTPVIGYGELIKAQLSPGSPVAEDMDVLLVSANRAKELVKQILTFSRQDRNERIPVEIHIIVKESLKLLRATIPTTITILVNIDPRCGQVLAEPTQLHQVVMNLCMNGYQAMQNSGGTLGVSLAVVEIEQNDALKKVNVIPGSYVRLEVSDTGHGMDREIVSRIFEPYFTTKGQGNGIGLSVVHGIIKKHSGHISVYSQPGRGTTFHVYLPRLGVTSQQEQAREQALAAGDEHILVVDDEKQIVETYRRMLETRGYKVTCFTDPLAALEKFRENPAGFDLVLTDMTMSHMTGKELASEMMALRADIPIILSTGFSELLNAQQAKAMGIRKYVMKPVTSIDLAGAVRKVLDG
ncbi:MAG: response regulator [Proteobacteria bacterium]|nr:response regulator [Pseudomonadota bacterium]MBU0966262.1 response regulator [Pseudomonadota bacterium]